MHPWPVLAAWLERVNRPETVAELEAVRRSVRRGRRYVLAAGQGQTAARLGLEYSLRLCDRPKKTAPQASRPDRSVLCSV